MRQLAPGGHNGGYSRPFTPGYSGELQAWSQPCTALALLAGERLVVQRRTPAPIRLLPRGVPRRARLGASPVRVAEVLDTAAAVAAAARAAPSAAPLPPSPPPSPPWQAATAPPLTCGSPEHAPPAAPTAAPAPTCAPSSSTVPPLAEAESPVLRRDESAASTKRQACSPGIATQPLEGARRAEEAAAAATAPPLAAACLSPPHQARAPPVPQGTHGGLHPPSAPVATAPPISELQKEVDAALGSPPQQRAVSGVTERGKAMSGTFSLFGCDEASTTLFGRARVEQMVESVLADTSPGALTRANPAIVRSSCEMLVSMLEGAVPDNTAKQEASNWRMWLRYCAWWGTSPIRASAVETPTEMLLVSLAVPWFLEHMRWAPGSTTPPKPTSALAILRGVRRMHVRLGMPFAPLAAAARATAFKLKEYVERHGHDALMPHRKEPLTNEMIVGLLSLDGRKISQRMTVNRLEPKWAMIFALYATLAQTGMRKAEVALPAGKQFGRQHLSRASLAWRIGGVVVRSPSKEQLLGLKRGDRAILLVGPSKADQYGLVWGPSPICLPFDDERRIDGGWTRPICAARELRDVELLQPCEGEARREMPLFNDGAGKPLRHDALDRLFHLMLGCVIPDENTHRYSMHSWRVYLACALLASGATGPQIQNMLRWRSDESLRIYARMNEAEQACWLDGAADAVVDSLRAHNVAAPSGAAARPGAPPQRAAGGGVAAARAPVAPEDAEELGEWSELAGRTDAQAARPVAAPARDAQPAVEAEASAAAAAVEAAFAAAECEAAAEYGLMQPPAESSPAAPRAASSHAADADARADASGRARAMPVLSAWEAEDVLEDWLDPASDALFDGGLARECPQLDADADARQLWGANGADMRELEAEATRLDALDERQV